MWIVSGLLVVSCLLTFALVAVDYGNSRFIRKDCADFSSYRDALAYLSEGNLQIDANHDGNPCQDRFKRDILVAASGYPRSAFIGL